MDYNATENYDKKEEKRAKKKSLTCRDITRNVAMSCIGQSMLLLRLDGGVANVAKISKSHFDVQFTVYNSTTTATKKGI